MSRKIQSKSFVLLMILSFALLTSTSIAHAANQVVSDCADNGGANQLRARLAAAQSSGGGTITFTCGPAAIVLQNGVLPTITTNTIINGAGKITLSGNNGSRLFYVNSGATLTLNSITITKGYNNGDGGAIGNDGTLNINGSKFLENQVSNGSGGAIISYGALNITNSEFGYNKGNNGGALYPRWGAAIVTITGSSFHHNETTSTTDGFGGAILLWDGASATINSSTLSANKARDGGAVYVTANSTLRLNTSTLRANSASNFVGGGGAIYNNGTAIVSTSTLSGNSATSSNYGGGILNSHGGNLTVTNSTLSGNTSDLYGGGIFNVGKGTVTHSTLFGNSAQSQGGGGIWHRGDVGDTFTLKNTVIVRGTTGENCWSESDSKTSIASAGFNLSSDKTCETFFNQGGDQNDKPALLGGLANNGGPTFTHLPSLKPKSPAIDNGACTDMNGAPVSKDQRNISRPQGLACDIGAIEVQPAAPTPTRSPTRIATKTPTKTPTRTPTTQSCNVKPGKPTLTAPANGKTLTKARVTLKWLAAQCAQKYKIVVKQDAKDGLKVDGAKVTSLSYKTDPLPKAHAYFWFVKACNSPFGCNKSVVFSFTLQ